MAASKPLHEQVGDITESATCTENNIGKISVNNIPKLVNTIPLTDKPQGVTFVNNEIIIASRMSSTVLDVYNSSTFKFQRCIRVPGLISPWDMVSIGNVLFISEYEDRLIHRVQLPEETKSNWKVDDTRLKLSVTKNGNLLVSNGDLKTLIEYTSTGILVREIVLQEEMGSPEHAIQLDNDQFAVCDFNILMYTMGECIVRRRVCIVDNKGQMITSFGGQDPGSQEGQMCDPSYLAVDPSGCILVADHNNNRIIKLNSDCKFVSEFIPSSLGLDRPTRIKSEEGKLYIVDRKNRLLIFGEAEETYENIGNYNSQLSFV
jgi:hypothetical protein